MAELAAVSDRDIYERLKKIVVVLICRSDSRDWCEEDMRYTGFVVGSDGLILTCNHCWKPASYINCLHDGIEYSTEVVKKNVPRDMLLLKVQSNQALNWDTAEFSPHDEYHAGMNIISIGHPLGMQYTFMKGHLAYPLQNVSYSTQMYLKRQKDGLYASETDSCRHLGNVRRDTDKFTQIHADLPLLQINNIHAAGGSSGSPVFDSAGKVVGMIIMGSTQDFAIAKSELVSFLDRNVV